MMNKILFLILVVARVGQVNAQELSWAARFGGTNYDNAYGIKFDTAENVISTGSFEGTSDFNPGSGTSNLTSVGDADVFLSKLDAGGNFIWAKRFGGVTEDYGEALAVDAVNNFYVGGYFNGTADFDPGPGNTNLTAAGDYDCFISKFDPSGNLLWARRIGSTEYEQVIAMAVDLTGNIVVTGLFNGTVDFDPGAGTSNLTSAGDNDIFVCKLNTSGNFIWARRMGGTGSDYARGVIIDSVNQVITTGRFSDVADFDPGVGVANLTSSGNTDAFISVLDASGNYGWAVKFGGANMDEGTAIYADESGNIFTTGVFQLSVDFDPGPGTDMLTSVGVEDVFISKLGNTGSHVWVRQLGGAGLQKTHAITADEYGNIYTSGYFAGTTDFYPGVEVLNKTSAGMLDVFVSKLNKHGDFVSVSQTGGTLDDRALDMVVDSSLHILVVGYFNGTSDFDPGAGVFNLDAAGNTDVFVLSLEQCQPTSATISPVVCDQFLSPDGTTTWTTSGTYMDTLVNAGGCDSVITVFLTVHATSYGELFVTACDQYVSQGGFHTWTTSGDYQDTLINVSGCDSVITIHLTIHNYTTATVNATGCDSYFLPDGTEVTVSGSYEKILVNSEGCDSIITFNITVVYSTASAFSVTACDSYTSPSGQQSWTESGVYTDIILNAVGCDSVMTINLEIIEVNTGVSQPGDALEADMSGAMYQWIDCGMGNVPVDGETNQVFLPAENGFYAVIISLGDCVDTSACIPYFIDGIAKISSKEILNIYPNPAGEYFAIDLDNKTASGILSVIDVEGREIFSIPFEGQEKLRVDLEIPSGLYFVMLTNGDKRMIGLLAKN
jgi:hypothetical protein